MRVPDDRTPKRRAFDRVTAYLNNHRHRLKLYEDRAEWHHLWNVWDTWHEDEGAIEAFLEEVKEKGEARGLDWKGYNRTNILLKGLMITLAKQVEITAYLYRHVFQVERFSPWGRYCPEVVKNVRNKLTHYNRASSMVIFWPETTLENLVLSSMRDGRETYRVTDLIEQQAEGVTRLLEEVADEMRRLEQKHRDRFKGDRLSEAFQYSDYAMTQIVVRDSTLLEWALDEVERAKEKFEAGAKDRGYDRNTEYEKSLELMYREFEQTLCELKSGYDLDRLHWDQKAEFLESRYDDMKERAGYIDEDFAKPASDLED